MATENHIADDRKKVQLIDAMKTVTKISKRVTPLIQQGCHQQRVYSEVLQVIAEADTVDAVEVVHGVWMNVKETEVYSPDHRCTFTHTAQTCSACNVRIGFIGAKLYLYDDYCPNCGASMMDGDGNG